MIRHLVTFSFDESASEAERRSVLDELATFPSRFPAMRNWTMGPNRSRRDRTFDWVFVVDFDDEDALVAYLDSAEHERFVAERWRPVVSHRAICSFATPTPTDRP